MTTRRNFLRSCLAGGAAAAATVAPVAVSAGAMSATREPS